MTAASASVAGAARRRTDRAAATTLAVAGAGLLVSLALTALPLAPGYRSAGLHVAIETIASCVTLVAAAVCAGRAMRTQALADVLLAASLGVQAGASVAFAMVPSIIGATHGPFATWAPASGRLLGLALLLGAVLAPSRSVRRPAGALGLWLAASTVVLGLCAGAVLVLGDALPPGSDTRASVIALQLVMATLYAVGAAGLSVRARDRRDELLGALATAAGLLAVARLDYALVPSLYTEWVYIGDVIRIAAWAVVLAGALREVVAAQRALAGAAVAEERRRLARDLHDGLAQELAFIGVEARRSSASTEAIAGAAERALAESRLAIVALTGPLDEPLHALLERAAETAATPAGARVRLRVAGDPPAGRETRKALMRIVREAVANAVRHGGARTIELELDDDAGRGARVVVRDDGTGFDTSAPRRRDAFGLLSMSERAEALGGSVDVRSAPGEGAEVEVRLP